MPSIIKLPKPADPRAYGYRDLNAQIAVENLKRGMAKDRYEMDRNTRRDASEDTFRKYQMEKGERESQLQADRYGFEQRKYNEETQQKRDAENFVFKSLYGKTKDELMSESKNPNIVPVKEPMPGGKLNGKAYGFTMGGEFTPQTSRVVGQREQLSPEMQKFKENPILPTGMRPEISPKDRYEMDRDRKKEQKTDARTGVEEYRRALTAQASILRAQMTAAQNSFTPEGAVKAAEYSAKLDKIMRALEAGPQGGYKPPPEPQAPELPAGDAAGAEEDNSLSDFNNLYEMASDEERAFIDSIPGGHKEKLAEIARRMPRQ